MRDATLCIIINENKILLGMKKRGFGSGKWNGFGGKVNENETIEDAAKRELYEETEIIAKNIVKVGEIKFIFPYQEEWNQLVHIFLVKEWEGTPKETEEMKPRWFDISEIPFDTMWQDDKFWLLKVLDGKRISAEFTFGEDNETIVGMNINED
jgi:mutator protein MutT